MIGFVVCVICLIIVIFLILIDYKTEVHDKKILQEFIKSREDKEKADRDKRVVQFH